MKVRNTLCRNNWWRSKISIPFSSRPIKNICPTGRHFIAIFICCGKTIFIETIISETTLPENILENSARLKCHVLNQAVWCHRVA